MHLYSNWFWNSHFSGPTKIESLEFWFCLKQMIEIIPKKFDFRYIFENSSMTRNCKPIYLNLNTEPSWVTMSHAESHWVALSCAELLWAALSRAESSWLKLNWYTIDILILDFNLQVNLTLQVFDGGFDPFFSMSQHAWSA